MSDASPSQVFLDILISLLERSSGVAYCQFNFKDEKMRVSGGWVTGLKSTRKPQKHSSGPRQVTLETIFNLVPYASCLVVAEALILKGLGKPYRHEQAGKEVTDGSSGA